MTAGAEDEQVGVLRDVDEHARRRTLDRARLDLDPRRIAAELLDLLLDEALGVASELRVEARRDEHGVEGVRRKRGIVRPRVHGDELRAAQTRLAGSPVHRLPPRTGPVPPN